MVKTASNIQREGEYELFENNQGQEILCLDGRDWYVVLEGSESESDLLVGADPVQEREKTLHRGKYYLTQDIDEEDEKNRPHLYLKDGGSYLEFVLPSGLPYRKGDKVRLVRHEEKVPAKEVEAHLG